MRLPNARSRDCSPYQQSDDDDDDTALLSVNANPDSNLVLLPGGLFLDNSVSVPFSTLPVFHPQSSSTSQRHDRFNSSSPWQRRKPVVFGGSRKKRRSSGVFFGGGFLSLSLSGKAIGGAKRDSNKCIWGIGEKSSTKRAATVGCESVVEVHEGKRTKARLRSRGAMNTTKHLWAGAVAAMFSRTFVAPLERLKLEYILRGEQRNISEVVRKIAVTQGLRGFWKGNLVNILRTAPFKAVNFCAFDTYRKQLLKLSRNEETTNVERFIAGAAAGITATALCLPLDTIRTKLVAPGGESLGGVIGAFRYVVQTEGFFALYRGLLPSILSMAPSGAVFYGVYDILKSTYLHSHEGRKRIQNLHKQYQVLNPLDQLELGPIRTLLHGAIAGACAEATTYPFEVVRRRLQMQGHATKLGALATCLKIVDQGGIPALYAGILPSLLQVLPSAAISYFVYEFMKIILKVE